MKPTGIWRTHKGVPSWASFACLYESTDLEWARSVSAERAAQGNPFAWVLYLEGPSKEAPVAAWGPDVRRWLEASGVLPFVAAVAYREEHYDGVRTLADIDAVWAWVSTQHGEIKRLFPSQAIVSIEPYFTPESVRAFGPAIYRPEFAHVDIRTVYTYVPAGSTWESELLDAKLALACGDAVLGHRLPKRSVVLVPQAFRHGEYSTWATWPREADTARAAQWAQRPEVIASWPFDLWSRDWLTDFQGYEAWPQRHALAALGVR